MQSTAKYMEKITDNPSYPVYTESSFFADYTHPSVRLYVNLHTDKNATDHENVLRLYYAIRDGFWYSPYLSGIKPEDFAAHNILSRSKQRGGHCIDKANLLLACVRAIGVPARLRFANVRNHIGTGELEAELGSDVLVFHGYIEIYLNHKWVKATPAFNKGLCKKLGVSPLEFDGVNDSIFQEFDKEGGLFMEYLHDYGPYPNIPYTFMVSEWKRYYPGFLEKYAAIVG